MSLPMVGFLGQAGSGKDTAGMFLMAQHGFYGMALADALKVFCSWMFDWDAAALWGPSEHRKKEDTRYPIYSCPICGRPSLDKAPHTEATSELDHHNAKLACRACACVAPPSAWSAHMSPRIALQHLGTDWVRTFNPRGHVDFLLRRIHEINAHPMPSSDPLYNVLPPKVHKQRHADTAFPRINGIYISDVRFKNEIAILREHGCQIFRILRDNEKDETVGMAGHASEQEQLEVTANDIDGTIDNNGTLHDLQCTIASIVRSL